MLIDPVQLGAYLVSKELKRVKAELQAAAEARRASIEPFYRCFRCGGAGWFDCYRHVEGGVCFRCRGDGIEPSTKKHPRSSRCAR